MMTVRTATACFAALVFGSACATSGASGVAEKRLKKCEADILFVGFDDPCAVVLDSNIYSKGFGKCKRIRWWVDDSLEYHWTITRKDHSADLLGGPYTIPAGDNTILSNRATGSGDWYYEVVVEDPDGEETCTADPLVIIHR